MQNDSKNNDLVIRLPSDLKLGENARKILALRFEQPDWTHKQIAQAVGVSTGRVGQILNHPRVLAAMPQISKQRITSMLPKAVSTYEKLLEQTINSITAEKVANRILTNEKVFSDQTTEVKVSGSITLKSVQELREIVAKASQLPENVIDAEVVEPSDDKAV